MSRDNWIAEPVSPQRGRRPIAQGEAKQTLGQVGQHEEPSKRATETCVQESFFVNRGYNLVA